MIKVLFVCHGNICRSPMAEAIFRKMVSDAGLSEYIKTDSCGTSAWHSGEAPHKGTREILKKYKIPYDNIYSAALKKEHFDFDYIIAMDEQNLRDIRDFGGKDTNAEISLLSAYCEGKWVVVPDPWYTGEFELSYKLVSEGLLGLLEHITGRLNTNNFEEGRVSYKKD